MATRWILYFPFNLIRVIFIFRRLWIHYTVANDEIGVQKWWKFIFGWHVEIAYVFQFRAITYTDYSDMHWADEEALWDVSMMPQTGSAHSTKLLLRRVSWDQVENYAHIFFYNTWLFHSVHSWSNGSCYSCNIRANPIGSTTVPFTWSHLVIIFGNMQIPSLSSSFNVMLKLY